LLPALQRAEKDKQVITKSGQETQEEKKILGV
jgi:hypothetical protein